MSLVTLPRAGMPLIGDKPMSREWYRWAHDITERVGGVGGIGNDELEMAQFEDAGIEELKFSIYRLADEFAQGPVLGADDWSAMLGKLADETNLAPAAVFEQIEQLTTEVNQLRDQVAVLMQSLQDLQQGTIV